MVITDELSNDTALLLPRCKTGVRIGMLLNGGKRNKNKARINSEAFFLKHQSKAKITYCKYNVNSNL